MKKVLLAALLATASIHAQDAPRITTAGEGPDPWFGTFSIIAFDPSTSELGVGVQSRAFGAGARGPCAEGCRRQWAGVGGGPGVSICKAGCGRRRDAGVGEPPIRPQGDRTARTGSVA